MATQVTVAAAQVDKERLGYQAISIDSLTATTAITIKAGSKVEVGGALYDFTVDETESGGTWAGLTASAIAWVYIVPAGASTTFIYSNTAPTYDLAKQGWYNGTSRAVMVLYKDAASLYQAKNIIPAGDVPITMIVPISSTVNPFIFNLPASSGSGMRIRVIDYATASTNLVRIHPAGTDNIGSAGNVDCYLQNIDQSTFVYKHQFLDLVDSVSGTWTVVGGQLCPHQATDTDGQQYHLGKLHHLPLGNTTARNTYNGLAPAAGAYSASISGWQLGVPNGAKAIRIDIGLYPYPAAAGLCSGMVALTDNNSNAATIQTAHPKVHIAGYASGAGMALGVTAFLDVPLNSSGNYYLCGVSWTNVTAGSCLAQIHPVGYYMGD